MWVWVRGDSHGSKQPCLVWGHPYFLWGFTHLQIHPIILERLIFYRANQDIWWIFFPYHNVYRRKTKYHNVIFFQSGEVLITVQKELTVDQKLPHRQANFLPAGRVLCFRLWFPTWFCAAVVATHCVDVFIFRFMTWQPVLRCNTTTCYVGMSTGLFSNYCMRSTNMKSCRVYLRTRGNFNWFVFCHSSFLPYIS